VRAVTAGSEQLCGLGLELGLELAQQLAQALHDGRGLDVVSDPEPLLPPLEWSRWLVAFAATQAVEVPIYVLALREHAWRQRLWVAFMASVITHPIAWAMGFVLHPFVLHAIVAETFAVVVEALWLRRHGVPKAVWWALTANAASVAVFIAGRSLVQALVG
jgi:hypothetical protein